MHRPHRQQQRLMICRSKADVRKEKRVLTFVLAPFYLYIVTASSGLERWPNLWPSITYNVVKGL